DDYTDLLSSFFLLPRPPATPPPFPSPPLFRPPRLGPRGRAVRGLRAPPGVLHLEEADPADGRRPQDHHHRHQHVALPVAADQLRSEEHTSELQSLTNIVCRLLLEKKTHEMRPP